MANKMERFANPARRVLHYAQEEADYLQNSSINPEHILVGLVRDEDGGAGKLLREMGASREAVQKLVEQMSRSPTPRMSASQHELSSGVKRVLELAVDEARRRKHKAIDSEHLLLGLLRLNEGKVLSVLRYLKIDPDQLRQRLEQAMER